MKDMFDVQLPNTGTVVVPVRRSLRSSRTVLRMKNGVFELVVPAFAGIEDGEISDFLRRSARWMNKILQKHSCTPMEQKNTVPDKIVLKAIREEYTLHLCQSTPVSWAGTRETAEKLLIVSGNTNSADEVLKSLRRWLLRKAEASLFPQARSLAELHGKHVAMLRTGLQRSIWGKCTVKNVITLNAALLFVPPDLVKYVILHELSHLAEMNHSPRFWAELEKLFPHAQEARKRLNSRSEHYVPGWVYGKEI